MTQEPKLNLKFYYGFLVIVALVILFTVIAHEALADSPKKHISIILSQACIKSNTCPDYKELAEKFDNSNKQLSGDFYQDKKGIWKRDKPLMMGAFEFYNNDITPKTIFVDPDDYTKQRTKVIFIETQIPIYTKSNKIQDATHITYHNRIISNCQVATIGWKQGGYDLLTDTITYFMSDCTTELKYQDEKKTIKPMDIKDKCGTHCKYLKWLESAKEKSKTKLLLPINKTLEDNKSTCKYERGEQICD